MKFNYLPIAGVACFALSSAASASVCINSDVADANIDDVQEWAKNVEDISGDISELIEEAPMAEAALGVVEVSAAATNLVAEFFRQNQMGNPHPVALNWDGMSTQPLYWNGDDGDTIIMTKRPGTGNLKFAQNHLTWWKGIVAFSKSDTNSWHEVACISDDTTAMNVPLDPSLTDDFVIVFAKAKAMGVHSNMYAITNWDEASTDFDYTFMWVND